ncbi:hypothetical protein [Stenotrophomonas sp. YIM B06876]|uniref:hypothetical protein n=1 Tax=Stenotrophomonas sp. YIM B06876 TaxID=3060211 RepID=UPI00273A093B|nr:hypothetical protein [Stenotrophomonas sp. YIM B06876]
MHASTPLPSRLAAAAFVPLVVMHSVVTLDLFFNLFPGTEAFRTLWAATFGTKLLWALASVIGAAAVVLPYRRPWPGLFASLAFCACLYFASVHLWGEVKGGFWLAVAATLLAGLGALRSTRPFKPAPLGRTS